MENFLLKIWDSSTGEVFQHYGRLFRLQKSPEITAMLGRYIEVRHYDISYSKSEAAQLGKYLNPTENLK